MALYAFVVLKYRYPLERMQQTVDAAFRGLTT